MRHLSPRALKIARIAGYVLLGFVTFLYALHYTFPYERIQDKVVEALASKYDVKIGGVERSRFVPGRFALTSVRLQSRPSVAGQPVTTMFFERIEVDVAFLPLLGGKAEIGLDVSTGNGGMTGTISFAKKDLDVDLKMRKFPLGTLPGVADAVGLPLGGSGDGHIRLSLPKGDWSKATGNIRLSCTVGCTVGDGVARVYPKAKREADALMVKDGIPVETVNVTRFVLGLKIAKGEAKKEVFEFESPDGEIELAVSIKLNRKWDDSVITGCIRYKCEPEYNRKAAAACDLGSPVVDKDGFHNIKLTGKLATMKRLGAVCDAGGGDGDAPGEIISNDKPRVRPSLDNVEPTGTDPATGTGAPPIQMGKPQPLGAPADDVNPRPDAPVNGATGAEPASGIAPGTTPGTVPGGATGTAPPPGTAPPTPPGTTPDAVLTQPPPPPPVPGTEGGAEQPMPEGGGATAPTEQPPIK
jgi:type II secretion system protein N